MSTSNYEIRVFIIGDYQVGKNSIVKRFKKMNSTQTEDDNYFIPGNPKTEYGLEKISTKEDQEKFGGCRRLKDIQKLFIRKQIERKNLMKFKKIFIVGKSRIEFNFFPIKSAEEKTITGLNDTRDEDEEIKFGDKLINFKALQEEIRNILAKEPKDSSSDLNNLFLFVYDLKDFSTFKKLELYHNKLNNYFKIDANYIKALIGNKADSKKAKKKKQAQKDRDYFTSFMQNNPGFKYYEISTYNYFNFENFFENLFTDVISPTDGELQKPTFLSRFHLVLHSRPNLSRAERKIHKVNDVPFLPEGENPDVYAYPEDKAEFRRTFSNMKKGRYGFKIFINKQGPIFPMVDKQNADKKHGSVLNKPVTAFGRDKKAKTAIGFGNWEINKRNKEIREALQTNVPGYSLGIRKGKYDFRKERKNKFNEREKELKSAFQAHYATKLLEKKEINNIKKDIDYNENKKERMKEIVERIQENENRHLKDREKNLLEKDNLLKEKIDKIKSKQQKYQQIYEKNQQEINQKRQEMSHPKTAFVRKTKPKDIQNYTLYDITTKHDPNKGWTMGMKYNYNPNKNKDDPDFPNLKSEFEKIVNNPKYAEIKYTAPRFKEEKIVKPSKEEKIYDDLKKNQKIKNNREKSERNLKIKKFLDEQKLNNEKVQRNKQKLKEEREIELEELKEQIGKPRNSDYDSGTNIDYVDINYKLVEEASPNYTMKGRYNHGSIFDMPDNYSLVNNEDEDEENKIGSNGKPIQDEEYKKSLPVPQYNVVKPSLPTYSFSKAQRFFSKPLYQPSPNAVQVLPFANGKFKPDDVKSFFKGKEGMYKAKKDNVLKNNGNPGPGQYKIKGFAEILAEKGKKISDNRDRIKRDKEMDMRKREEEKNNGDRVGYDNGNNNENNNINNNNDRSNNNNEKKMEMKLDEDDMDDDNDNTDNVNSNSNNNKNNTNSNNNTNTNGENTDQ